MKNATILLLGILLVVTKLQAQLPKLASPASVFSQNLAKITLAFRSNYYEIQGVQLPSQEDMDVFKSLVQLPGAKHCTVFRFHSKIDTTASFQAIMYEGDNYKEAVKVYKNTCKLVDKTQVQLGGSIAADFKGKMEDPDDNLRFVTTGYTLDTKDPAYVTFYAEVEMLNINFDQWEVHVNLQQRKNDEEKE